MKIYHDYDPYWLQQLSLTGKSSNNIDHKDLFHGGYLNGVWMNTTPGVQVWLFEKTEHTREDFGGEGVL